MSDGTPFEKLDQLLQHKVRLGACVLLSQTESLSFSSLKETLEATDGNLGAQLTKLETHDYLKVSKEFIKKKPVTRYSLTQTGQTALDRHFDALQEILQTRDTPSPQKAALPIGKLLSSES